jgi:hypothetical protein
MLTLTHPEKPQSISDLAAGLTDLALELLGKAGVQGDSVEMELALWRELANEIEREFGRYRLAPSADDIVPNGVIEHIVHRAALRVAGEFDGGRSPADLEAHVRPGVAELRVPADRQAAAGRLMRREEAGRRPLGQSGIFRALRVTALN